MQKTTAHYYELLKARDARFDGRFYTGVHSTGIFCRPVCPARTPLLKNVSFYPSAAAAMAAGLRPCLRCKPELAPAQLFCGSQQQMALQVLRWLDAEPNSSVTELAQRLHISDRQLRRIFTDNYGCSPQQVLQTQRLLRAKQLIDQSALAMTDIAYQVGYGTVRQFNQHYKSVYGRSPSEQRQRQSNQRMNQENPMTFILTAAEPYAGAQVLAFLRFRQIAGVEWVAADTWFRAVVTPEGAGTVSLTLLNNRQWRLQLSEGCPMPLAEAVCRAQRMLDLHSDSAVIDQCLAQSALLAPLVAKHPGLKLPLAWDAYECAMRAVAGQQVTVAACNTLVGRLAERFGQEAEVNGRKIYSFPDAATLANADLVKIGMPAKRVAALQNLAQKIAQGAIVLDGSTDTDQLLNNLCALAGIGPWTANYIAMRGVGEPNAFPAGDLVLRQMATPAGADKLITPAQLTQQAAAWQPWRAYAVMQLWQAANDQKNKDQ